VQTTRGWINEKWLRNGAVLHPSGALRSDGIRVPCSVMNDLMNNNSEQYEEEKHGKNEPNLWRGEYLRLDRAKNGIDTIHAMDCLDSEPSDNWHQEQGYVLAAHTGQVLAHLTQRPKDNDRQSPTSERKSACCLPSLADPLFRSSLSPVVESFSVGIGALACVCLCTPTPNSS